MYRLGSDPHNHPPLGRGPYKSCFCYLMASLRGSVFEFKNFFDQFSCHFLDF